MIEVTRLFDTEVPEFSVRASLGAKGFDPSRSFIESVKAFPANIETEVTQTYTAPPDNNPVAAILRDGSATVLVDYSMVKLPDVPMKPRLFDERVGYFLLPQTDYGAKEQTVRSRIYITRWRMEKKDPGAALSEPVRPHRFLHRSGHARRIREVGEEGRGRLAARLRSRRFPQRHRGARCSLKGRRPELEYR